ETCSGSTSISATTLPPCCSRTSIIRVSSGARLSMRSSPSSPANGSAAPGRVGRPHGVAESPRVALPHVVHGGQFAGLADLGQPLVLFLGGQRLLELIRAIEVVLDGNLAPAGDEQHVVPAGRDGL